MPTLPVIVNSLVEMHSLGLALGQKLTRGDILLLNGSLGAGKTSLVQGIAAALNISGVTSPTFVILKVYDGKIGQNNIKFVHVDAYRAENIERGIYFILKCYIVQLSLHYCDHPFN